MLKNIIYWFMVGVALAIAGLELAPFVFLRVWNPVFSEEGLVTSSTFNYVAAIAFILIFALITTFFAIIYRLIVSEKAREDCKKIFIRT